MHGASNQLASCSEISLKMEILPMIISYNIIDVENQQLWTRVVDSDAMIMFMMSESVAEVRGSFTMISTKVFIIYSAVV